MDSIHSTEMLEVLKERILGVLGPSLLGLYVYGSLAWGDFDEDISDLDLLAVLDRPLRSEDLARLGPMHGDLEGQYPAWADRIEVQYAPRAGLMDFRDRAFAMGNISPGEPFHLICAGREWLTNWYAVARYGRVLHGPEPSALLPRVSQQEFLGAVRDLALTWRQRIANTQSSRGFQSYAVLTLCRALRSLHTGEQCSKAQAAQWAKVRYPELEEIIDLAWVWRGQNREESDPSLTYAQVYEAVMALVARVEEEFPTEN